MSLLNRGTETVKVFSEEMQVDDDGNKITRAAKVGTLVRAVVQPISTFNPAESADGGFHTESRYRLRLINYPGILGAQSQVEWLGKRYAIHGDAQIYNGSARTRHVDYQMVRK